MVKCENPTGGTECRRVEELRNAARPRPLPAEAPPPLTLLAVRHQPGSDRSGCARSASSRNSGLLLSAQRSRVFHAAGLPRPPPVGLPLNSAHA
ncbi:hypothetical protein EYF80_053468 [Liparis tanakae]|uniref:Uncharacterized protein n=1 Tax=Liparis tanakae TaxID=230148 RepID=A0A4Z2F5M2_9TELE|nr:hypothetical protein EYF80_053468 [Liparis tanakae]